MTITLPAGVQRRFDVLVSLGDRDGGQNVSARAVYELLHGLCVEVYRERLPSAPDDADTIEAIVRAVQGIRGETHCDTVNSRLDGISHRLSRLAARPPGDERPAAPAGLEARVAEAVSQRRGPRAKSCPGGADPGLRKAVKRVEAELRHHEGSRVPAGYAANLVSEALTASEGAAPPSEPDPEPRATWAKSPLGWDPSCWTGEDPEAAEPGVCVGRVVEGLGVVPEPVEVEPEPSQTPDAPGWWWLDAFGDGKWSPARVLTEIDGGLVVRASERLDFEPVGAFDGQWGGRCTRGAQSPTGDPARGAELAASGVVRYAGLVAAQDYRDALARIEELEGAQAPDDGEVLALKRDRDSAAKGLAAAREELAGLRKRVEALTADAERTVAMWEADPDRYRGQLDLAFAILTARSRAALEVQP